jgi:hypothetical protein
MSYDLMFMAGSGKKIDRKAFRAHFGGRKNYEVGKEQAVYQNEDTGVYFIFDEPEDGVVAFNLNYFRPHVFALEAALELEQFAAALEAVVNDPQGEMEDGGTFSIEGFLRGWTEGNRLAFRAMLKERSEPVHTWPAQRIREVWDWNHARPEMQEQAGESLFVPGIFAVESNGAVLSVAIWPPECTILMPAVDAVLVPVAQSGEPSEEMALVDWAELLPLVQAYQEPSGEGLARYRLAFEEWPPEIAEFLGKAREPMAEMNGITLDQVLDRELVEETRRG